MEWIVIYFARDAFFKVCCFVWFEFNVVYHASIVCIFFALRAPVDLHHNTVMRNFSWGAEVNPNLHRKLGMNNFSRRA